MASNSLIAAGVIHLDNGNTNLPIYVYSDGLKILKDGNTPGNFFDQITVGRAEKVTGTGHMVFTSLFTAFPAAPSGDTFPAKLEYNSDELTLTLENQGGTFARLPNAHFSDLKVVFSQKKTGKLKLEEGSAAMTLMDVSFPLSGKIANGQFGFHLAEPPVELTLSPVGTAVLNEVEVVSDQDRWENLQLLYDFRETEGDLVFDNSGKGPGVDLHFKDGRRLGGGGLAFNTRTEAISDTVAERVIKAIEKEDAFSVELWIKSTATRITKPMTILSLGNNTGPVSKNFFSLQIDRDSRLVIDGSFATARAFVGPTLSSRELAHVVFTHDKSGKERIYVDGVTMGSRTITGDINNFNDLAVLVLGNSPKKDEPWQGECYGVAIYNRALSEADVTGHFRPAVNTSGTFTINNAPAPLDTPLPATFELLKDEITVDVKLTKILRVTPNLLFTNLQLQWLRSKSGDWSVNGGLKAAFWKNKVDLLAALSGTPEAPLLELTPKTTPIAISLDDWGSLEFTGLKLKVAGAEEVKWELSTTTDQAFVILPAIRHRAFDLFADFLLEGPHLGLSDDFLLLKGKWLENSLEFHGSQTGKDFGLVASASFEMLFDFSVPPIIDSKTGEKLNEGAELNQSLMNIMLGLELSRNGLLTKVDSNFDWQDQDGVGQHSIIPAFRLYTPPPNRNAILGHIVGQLQTHISELFEQTGKQLAEYKLAKGDDQPRIFLTNPKGLALDTEEDLLPGHYGKNFTSPKGVFDLKKSGNDSKLKLSLNKSQSDIDADYEDFQQHLADESVGLGEMALIRRRIAERLPLHFDRLLYYYYGLNASGGFSFIDLHPGMRLRIDFQNYQFVQASDPTASRGFTGSGSTYVQMAGYTHKTNGAAPAAYHQLLGFDPFLAQLQAEGRLDIANQGAGGLFDLLKAENRKAAYRLFFPLDPSQGSGPERVTTIVGADSLSEMNLASANFISNANTPPFPGISFFFRGRTSITPEIQVFVRDQATYVPVGTTLRQLMQRYDDIPGAGIGEQDLSVFLQSAKPLRLLHKGVNSKPVYRFINLENTEAVNKMDVLDLPLVKGDRFYF